MGVRCICGEPLEAEAVAVYELMAYPRGRARVRLTFAAVHRDCARRLFAAIARDTGITRDDCKPVTLYGCSRCGARELCGRLRSCLFP